MDGLFSAADPPPIQDPGPPPTREDPEVERRRREAATQEQKISGRAGTLLTGADGDTSAAPVVRAGLKAKMGA